MEKEMIFQGLYLSFMLLISNVNVDSEAVDYTFSFEMQKDDIIVLEMDHMRYNGQTEWNLFFDAKQNFYLDTRKRFSMRKPDSLWWNFAEMNVKYLSVPERDMEIIGFDARIKYAGISVGSALHWDEGEPIVKLVAGTHKYLNLDIFILPASIYLGGNTYTHDFKVFEKEAYGGLNFALGSIVGLRVKYSIKDFTPLLARFRVLISFNIG